MQRISITNPQNIIDGTAKKYYFKLRNTGGPKGDKGDKGDTGATGPQGPQGDPCTVVVNSTATLEPGSSAYVTNTGSLSNAVLNFGIPKGDRGPQGAKGDKGDTGAQGETGPRGPQGAKGTNATVYVGTTTTTNPGTQARVYNSGTDSNAVLNFEIPRGDVGPSVPLVQETGYSTTKAMSQNATTEALNGKQATIDSSHKLSADLVDDTTTTHKFVTASDKTTWNAKQNALTAGDNITISGDTISATDTTYTAGDNITITGTTISTSAIAPEVVAELPATGTEGKLYLTPKAHTTQTATGNPITATVAEDAGALESFQLDGDTFQQSYTGKNLIATTRTAETKNGVTCTWDGASFTLNGTTTASTDFYGRGWWGATSDPIVLSAGAYTISLRKSDGSLATDADFSVDCYYGTTHIIGIYRGNYGTGFSTVTFDSDTQYSVFYISLGSGKTYNNEKFYVQLEKSESPTPYEPFVGGTPSPSPEYPQPIQTVTGLQTISINGTDYPIDLGSIELCKLGTYQDYIWKDGEDWKVHKAIDKHIFDGSESFSLDDTYGGIHQFRWSGTSVIRTADQNTTFVLSDRFRGVAFDASWTKDFTVTVIANRDNPLRFMTSLSSTLEAFKAWLASNQTTTYFVRKTTTDTVITDTALISQLEAICTASLQNGANTITNTATGSNLAGDMEIGYYSYNPRNRYDKWLWLDINNEYEQIGS